MRQRPDLMAILLMLFLIGTFGLNFPIFLSTMSVTAFHAGAGQYGVLSSVMACGSVAGALLAAGRGQPTLALLLGAAALFGLACALAAVMPNYWLFGMMLVVIGIAAQTLPPASTAACNCRRRPPCGAA